MNFEILVSTMNLEDSTIVKKMNITSNALIVNQCSQDKEEKIVSENKTIRIISVNEIGLSKSRNRALDNAIGDICLISDDDMVFYNDISDKVLEVAEKNPSTSVFVFEVDNRVKKFAKSSKLSFHDLFKVSSVQIAFRREVIINNKIRFNERFGSGSREYLSGEENIFLKDCYNKNLEIKYFPLVVGRISESDSSWFKGYNSKYFYDKGALFIELLGDIGFIYGIIFVMKKYRIFKKDITVIKALRNFFLGARDYKIQPKESQ